MESSLDTNHRQREVGDVKDLDDANLAGTAESKTCTLILTEGYAAKSLAVAGLVAIGRDKYGLYPLTHKLINVRKSPFSEVEKSVEVRNLMKIMGLCFERTYKENHDLSTLRYGHLMLMMDRDEDGSHMKGLVINFFHYYWPSLLRRDFLVQFVTPVVKVFYTDHEQRFYTFLEYENWLQKKSKITPYTVRFYKSLEAFTPSEIQGYFSHLDSHIVHFIRRGPEDDDAIQLFFEKDRERNRKKWMSESLHESFSYYEGIREITYSDFVNKELLFYSDLHNVRSIPSAIDGLTRSQRKVLYTCFKNYADQEVNVLQLIGSVFEVSGYKQSLESLSKTIVNMGQDFMGSNNINILLPLGQFGTRIQGGKDAGKNKYIYTKLNPVSKLLFPDLDNSILQHHMERNSTVEPYHYLPVIPLILVNGAEGIGMGWSTKIPMYNPKDIIQNIYRKMADLEFIEMMPWFRNFTGTVEKIAKDEFCVSGVLEVLENNQIRITELPIDVWTQNYREKVLDPMLQNFRKDPPKITRYEEYHTDGKVDFLVTLARNIPIEKLNEIFHLQKVIKTSNIVAFDHKCTMKKYDSAKEILEEFYNIRLQGYESRKRCIIERLQLQLSELENMRQQICRKEEIITFVNKQRNEIISLSRDCLNSRNTLDGPHISHQDGSSTFLSDIWGFTERKIEELNTKCLESKRELRKLQKSTAEDLWKEELRKICETLGITVQETFQAETGVLDESTGFYCRYGPRVSTPIRVNTMPVFNVPPEVMNSTAEDEGRTEEEPELETATASLIERLGAMGI